MYQLVQRCGVREIPVRRPVVCAHPGAGRRIGLRGRKGQRRPVRGVLMRRSRPLLSAGLVVAASLVAPLATPAAVAGPVMCADGDVSPDGRVFPEPLVSNTFVTFPEF